MKNSMKKPNMNPEYSLALDAGLGRKPEQSNFEPKKGSGRCAASTVASRKEPLETCVNARILRSLAIVSGDVSSASTCMKVSPRISGPLMPLGLNCSSRPLNSFTASTSKPYMKKESFQIHCSAGGMLCTLSSRPIEAKCHTCGIQHRFHGDTS